METTMNLKNTCISACVCAAGFVVLGACGGASVSAGVGTGASTTSAVVVDNDHAIDALTKARCDRENACNNIGPNDKKFDSFDACQNEIRHDTAITLRPEKCQNGVIADRLDSCLDQIRTERCGNALDKIERVAVCRKAMLCR
jgi:hypothetical protein